MVKRGPQNWTRAADLGCGTLESAPYQGPSGGDGQTLVTAEEGTKSCAA